MARKYSGFLLVFVCILSMLTSCDMALGTPSAGTLLSFLCEDFTCGFSVMENGTPMAAASYVRKVGCDTLTYEKNGLRATFRFENGVAYLLTRANETESPLTLPIKLPKEYGAERICEIFSLFPSNCTDDDAWLVIRTNDGYRLEFDGAPNDMLIWTFSSEMEPLSVTYGDTTLTFTSFSGNT